MSSLEQGLVISNQQLSADLFELVFLAPDIAKKAQPGQFVNIKVSDQNDPLLRRPISIYDIDHETGKISLLYKVVGRGTQLMTGIKAQAAIDVMGPLGKGFTLPTYVQNTLLVGGGVGIAPLMYLARCLKELECQVTVFYGAGSSNELAASERFRQLGVELHTAAMDGTAGYHGPVTDLLQDQDPYDVDSIYTCGPEVMMAAVAEYVGCNYLWGECSLEAHMACGVGACLGCARKLKRNDEEYIKICKDGPVFNIMAVDLNIEGEME